LKEPPPPAIYTLSLHDALPICRFETEACRVRKDGSRFWASVVITPVLSSSGELRGFAQVVRDLTERREAEEERVRLAQAQEAIRDRKSTRLNSSHLGISYAVFC